MLKQITLLLLLLLYPAHNGVALPFSFPIIKLINYKWLLPTVIGLTSLVLTNAYTYWYMQQKGIADVYNARFKAKKKFIEKIQDPIIAAVQAVGVEVERQKKDDKEDQVTFRNLAQDKLEAQNKYIVQEGFLEHQDGHYLNVRAQRLEEKNKEIQQSLDNLLKVNASLIKARDRYIQTIKEKEQLIDYGIDEKNELQKKLEAEQKKIENFRKLLNQSQTSIVIPDNCDPGMLLQVFKDVGLPLTENNNNNDSIKYLHQRKIAITFASQRPRPPSKSSSSLTLSPPPLRPPSEYKG